MPRVSLIAFGPGLKRGELEAYDEGGSGGANYTPGYWILKV